MATRYSKAQAEADMLAIFEELRVLREAYKRGEVDAEGEPIRETLFDNLSRRSTPVQTE